MQTKRIFRDFHKVYLKENHNIFPPSKLKVKLASMGLETSIDGIKTQLALMNLPYIEEEQERKDDKGKILRKNAKAVSRHAQKIKKQMREQFVKEAIKSFYRDYGASRVRKELGKSNYYLTTEQIADIAKEMGIKRKVKSVEPFLKDAKTVIDQYNEKWGTNFYTKKKVGSEGVGFVEDPYVSSDKKDLIDGLVIRLFDIGYSCKKVSDRSFLIS